VKDTKYFERNITLNYIIGALMWGRFFIPVLALFYIASQVTLEQFTIIMAAFSLTTLILEIPTGVMADLLGKKNTLLIARAMYVIELILVAFGNGFWVFLVAKIISGIGVSMSSGTSSALLYDSLKKLGREKEHKYISGLANTIAKVSMAFVFIVGAFLFNIHYKLPALISIPLVSVGFLLTFFLTEPYPAIKKFTLANSLNHMQERLAIFKVNYYLKYLAFFTFLIGSTISILLGLSSKYFEAILIPIYLIGIISFVMNMIAAYSAKKAHAIEERLGEKQSIYLISIVTIISVMFVAFLLPYLGVLFFLFLAFVQGFYEVIVGDYVNQHIHSTHRATMLSINNMFDNIGIALLFPAIGYIGKAYSFQTALYVFGIFVFLTGLFLFILYRNGKPIAQEMRQ